MKIIGTSSCLEELFIIKKVDLPNIYPIQQDWIDKVKNDRQFAYEVLCGGRPHTQKPQFCPISDKGIAFVHGIDHVENLAENLGGLPQQLRTLTTEIMPQVDRI